MCRDVILSFYDIVFELLVNKEEERLRRVQSEGRFFEKAKRIPYLWVNHLFPLALVIALIFVLVV